MQNTLNQTYWNTRWQAGQTGWDLGTASPPIAEYIDQYSAKNAAILIPGCGNAYEAEYLLQQGFSNITLLDIAPEAVAKLQSKFAGKKAIRVLCEDFFEHKGTYDLIIEQTFFCALPPEKREDYAFKTANLLCRQGRLAGVLFNRNFEQEGPPFGGTVAEYKALFQPYFYIHTLAPCTNSIPPRAGTEVFINLEKT